MLQLKKGIFTQINGSHYQWLQLHQSEIKTENQHNICRIELKYSYHFLDCCVHVLTDKARMVEWE